MLLMTLSHTFVFGNLIIFTSQQLFNHLYLFGFLWWWLQKEALLTSHEDLWLFPPTFRNLHI